MVLRVKTKDWLLLFCVTAGLLATLWGYNYSAGNAEEQLPFIYRALDPSYLTRDFFTNTFAEFGPRTIYSEFIAFFARFAPLTAVLFSFTFISNIAIAYISALTARFFFEQPRFSAFLAAASVLTVKTFWLGYSNIIYRTFLEPAHLVMPFLLLGFYLILQKRYIFSALSFCIAALFHPLLGLETGWLLIGASILVVTIQVIRKEARLSAIIPLGVGSLILAGFSAGLLLPYSYQTSIPSDVFINLIAYVRHPHHYLPSTWELWQYGQAALYLTAFGFAFWFAMKRSETLRACKQLLFLIGGLLLILCIGGYLFVEIWPSRIWTAAQLFRLLYLVKWFSIVIMAAWVGNLIETPAENESRLFGLTAGLSLVTPVSSAIAVLALWARKVILPRVKLPAWLVHDVMVLTLVVAAIVIYKPEFRVWALFLVFFVLMGIMFLQSWRTTGFLISATVSLSIAILFLLFAIKFAAPKWLNNEVPVFSLFPTSGETVDVANFAKANTPSDALFLTLPKFGEFRTLADRAIVVDFVAFPFQDAAMLEWHTRMVDCYGTTDLLGFNALPELNHRFHSITDDQLNTLTAKYGIDYAVVYSDTVTNFPVLYQTESFKLIQILK